MSRLKEKVNRAKSGSRRVEVIFYYSGHSDDQNILLGSDRVSYEEFRNKINGINADVRIAVPDSCASGAFNLLKCVKKKAPFLVDTAYESMPARWLIKYQDRDTKPIITKLRDGRGFGTPKIHHLFF